jgi:uncharacterized membrane protein YeiH
MSSHTALGVLELARLFVFAISGALTAIQKGFDAVGILILAEVTALGGTPGLDPPPRRAVAER